MYGATAGKQKSGSHELTVSGAGLLRSIETDLQALSTHLARIGGKSDGVGLREDIRKLRTQLKRSISEEQVRQCRLLEQHNDIRSQVREQLLRDAQQLYRYTERLYQLMDEERRSLQGLTPTTAAVEETDWGGVPLLHTTAYRDVTQTESDATALEEIQQEIVDLRDVQATLGRLLHDQGRDIDNIEKNVGIAHHDVVKGRKALGEGAKWKGSSRRKKYCIAVCVVVAITIPLILAGILVALLVRFL